MGYDTADDLSRKGLAVQESLSGHDEVGSRKVLVEPDELGHELEA